jgi:hypothetical protein
LNVALSRAQGLAVLVASPALLRIACRSPEEIRLVNAFCRFVEVAAEQSTGRDDPADRGAGTPEAPHTVAAAVASPPRSGEARLVLFPELAGEPAPD